MSITLNVQLNDKHSIVTLKDNNYFIKRLHKRLQKYDASRDSVTVHLH